MKKKFKAVRAFSLTLSTLLVAVPVFFNLESANAAPKVTKPSIAVVQTSAGISAITVTAGTKYAGKAIAIAKVSSVPTLNTSNVITAVKVGRNGKAVALTNLSIEKGDVLSATVGTKQIVRFTVATIRIVPLYDVGTADSAT